MKQLAAIALAFVFGTAQAKCLTHDSWTGPDKVKHLAAGFAIGSAGTLVFKDAGTGFLIGAAAGVLIETQGVCSLQDAAVTALGAAAGAYGTAWLVLPTLDKAGKPDGLQVVYSKAF